MTEIILQKGIMSKQNDILTEEEARAILRCSRFFIRKLRESGRLPHLKEGRFVRYRKEDIDKLFQQDKTEEE